jgi:hypothetical protein
MEKFVARISGGILTRLISAAAVLILTASAAAACAICLSGFVVTIGQKLDSADRAVLAMPVVETGQFRIIDVIKGDVAIGGIITDPGLSAGQASQATGPLMTLDGPATAPSSPAAQDGKPLLLLWNRLAERWTSVGAIGAEYGGWLREFAIISRGSDGLPARVPLLAGQALSYLTDAEWRERVTLVAPYLESPDPLVAEIAYSEIARAPYNALSSLKTQLDATKIAKWIDDRKLAPRQSGYTLLLGIAGGPDDATELEERMRTAREAHDATNLSAMLAADLELRGPARVDWVEHTYLADHSRNLPEINAALLALSVHGGASGVIPRERVIEAYRFFIEERKPMAGFVAQDLADWEAWDATSQYMAILGSNAVKDPASEFMIVRYIQRSPDASAKEALQAYLDQSE